MAKKLSVNDIGFRRGFACACAIMVYHQGGLTHTEVEDVYRCNFMTIAQLRAAGVDEEDINKLKPVIKELVRREKL